MSSFQSAARSRSDTAAFCRQEIVSSSTKRVHSEIADDGDEGTRSKKRKTDESAIDTVNRFIFFPLAVYGYKSCSRPARFVEGERRYSVSWISRTKASCWR